MTTSSTEVHSVSEVLLDCLDIEAFVLVRILPKQSMSLTKFSRGAATYCCHVPSPSAEGQGTPTTRCPSLSFLQGPHRGRERFRKN